MSNSDSLARALTRLRAPLALIGAGALLFTVFVSVIYGLEPAAIGLCLVIPVLLLGVQYACLSRASASQGRGIVWILASYPIRILILVICLYVPRSFDVDVRFPALCSILVILLSMLAEVIVIARAPHFNVDERDQRTSGHSCKIVKFR